MLVAFCFAFAASFWGSLPPGPGNLSVLHTVLHHHTRAGLWLALGACLPELPYSFLAVQAVQYVSAFESVKPVLGLITILILFVMGVYAIFFHHQTPVNDETIPKRKLHPFWKGVLVAAFNPMLIAFWLVASDFGQQMGCLNLHKLEEKAAFVLGTSVGAFALLTCVALLTKKIKQHLTTENLERLHVVVGISFLVIGILQALEMYGNGTFEKILPF
jgi:threonine/homoserine/homoserine lactone efflux protein